MLAGKNTNRAFTLIEILVAISAVCILFGLILPAVQSVREAARRLQCVNNVKQSALALQNYRDALGCFPMGTPLQAYPDIGLASNHSIFVSILPHLMQGDLYDSVNFATCIVDRGNRTVRETSISSLLCPSDGTVHVRVSPSRSIGMVDGEDTFALSSYAGCAGTWYNHPSSTSDEAVATIPRLMAAANGAFFLRSALRMSNFRDGTSATFLLGERAHGRLDPEDARDHHWWFHSYYSDTLFHALYPPNSWRVFDDGPGSISSPNAIAQSAGSAHPGGANFAFADGSVRFVKETISSWPIDRATGGPVGVSGSLTTAYRMGPAARPGVYQALATRAGGEIVNSLTDP